MRGRGEGATAVERRLTPASRKMRREESLAGSNVIARMTENIATVEKLLGGYEFRKPELLAEALTHPSYSPRGPNYDRLEFIGDAVLTLVISNYLYVTNPHDASGPLTTVRAANINTEKLARIAVRHDLYSLLLRVSSDLDLLVDHFAAAVRAENLAGDLDGSVAYGGTTVSAPKVLADVVESIIGAVYVDSDFNLETTWVAIRMMLEPIITDENHREHPMSRLNEICQKNGWTVKCESFVDDAKYFMNVFVDGNQVGVGCSHQKNIAKLIAVKDALSKLDVKESVTPVLRPRSDTADCYIGSITYASPATDLTVNPTTTATTDGEKDGKKNLNDLCTKNHWMKPIYRVETAGPAHERRFKCSVEVKTSSCGGAVVTSGEFKSKIKDAENCAAYRMLIELRSINR